MENDKKPSQTVLRILVILGILAILVFLSIGIVRIVPRALSALAGLSTSISNVFKPGSKTTTKTGTTTTTVSTSTGGFIIISTSTPTTIGSVTKTPSTNTTGSKTQVKTGTTYKPTTTYSNTYVPGNPDLAVTIVSKGIIDKTSGRFVETNNFTTNDTVVVKFKIENQGTGSTGIWNLHVAMPSQIVAEQVKDLTGNASIPPGRAIEGQAIFNNPRMDSNPTVIISAISTNTPELNEGNNISYVPLYVTSSNYPANYGGAPDLAVRNLQTGILTADNQFIPTNIFRVNDRVAVRYEVVNYGPSDVGPWYFQAALNTSPISYYNSGAELNIPGNSSVIYTIAYNNVPLGANSITIALDPNAYTVESNESNNVASVNFTVTP